MTDTQDAIRLDAVNRARMLKSSWLKAAELLIKIRDRATYVEWGYEDLYSYCAMELQIDRRTCDKLTGAMQAIERHAPDLLEPGAAPTNIPTLDAVDYFARAMRGEPKADGTPYKEPTPEVIEELKQATFKEGRPARSMARQFGPLLHPVGNEQEELQRIMKAQKALRQLSKHMGDIENIPDNVSARFGKTQAALSQSLGELADACRILIAGADQ